MNTTLWNVCRTSSHPAAAAAAAADVGTTTTTTTDNNNTHTHTYIFYCLIFTHEKLIKTYALADEVREDDAGASFEEEVSCGCCTYHTEVIQLR